MIRKARIEDIKKIHHLVNQSAAMGEMLPRSLGELYDNLRDYFVCIEGDDIVGTGGLHICWENLAEVRSLCVADTARKKGIGRAIVDVCVEEAKTYDINKLFLLTYQVEFFKKCGFTVTDKKVFPHKIWSDCVKCPKFPECDETAMIREIGKR